MLRPLALALVAILASACTDKGSKPLVSDAESPSEDGGEPRSLNPKAPTPETVGTYATKYSCLGAGGQECPDGLLCVNQPGHSGGSCENRPRGASCGAQRCTREEMCCDGTCMRPQARAICRPGHVEPGWSGMRCGPNDPCQGSLSCVTPADRLAGNEASAGHCAVAGGEGTVCSEDTRCLGKLVCREASEGERRCLPPRTDGPCKTDADCRATASCSCACVAILASIPPKQGEEWMTMCDGGPPPNCGVASPCMNFVAACDAETASCVVRPAPEAAGAVEAG